MTAATTPPDAGNVGSPGPPDEERAWTDAERAAAEPLPLPEPPGDGGGPHAGRGRTLPAGAPPPR